MADGLLPLSPASPGGQIEDIEQLNVVPPTPPAPPPGFIAVVRQRIQLVGRLYNQIAAVLDSDPATTDYGVVTRNLPARTATPPDVTNVPANAINTTLLAANPARRGASFQADRGGTGVLLLKLGAAASAVSYTVALVPGAYYELPDEPLYTGQIDGIWDVAAGAVLVTEQV